MASRRTPTMDVHEVVRLLQAGASDREVAQLVGRNRRTVARYRRWAEREGVLPVHSGVGELETRLAASLPATLLPQQTSTVERYREEIVALRAQGVEAAAIKTRLEERHQVPISYSAVWRLVRRLEPPDQRRRSCGWRCRPGRGPGRLRGGRAGDRPGRRAGAEGLGVRAGAGLESPQLRRGRVRPAGRDLAAVPPPRVRVLRRRPQRVVLDNLKAAIIKASLHDPVVQRSYRECAQHYGFRIAALPPRTPHLKGRSSRAGSTTSPATSWPGASRSRWTC